MREFNHSMDIISDREKRKWLFFETAGSVLGVSEVRGIH